MAWIPVFDIASSDLSNSEKEILADERSYRNDVLGLLSSIDDNIRLLTAVTEEAFDTKINANDLE